MFRGVSAARIAAAVVSTGLRRRAPTIDGQIEFVSCSRARGSYQGWICVTRRKL